MVQCTPWLTWCLVILSISVNYLPASVPLTSSEPMTLLIRTQVPRAQTKPQRSHTAADGASCVAMIHFQDQGPNHIVPSPHLSLLLSSPLHLMPPGSQMAWMAYGFNPINATFGPLIFPLNDPVHVL